MRKENAVNGCQAVPGNVTCRGAVIRHIAPEHAIVDRQLDCCRLEILEDIRIRIRDNRTVDEIRLSAPAGISSEDRTVALAGMISVEKAIGADIPIDAVDEAALAQIVHKCTTISVREHCSKTVKAFFSFCMEQYKLEKNPTTNIKVEKIKKDELPPSVLPPAKIKEIFETLPQKANILATFALLAFAGLRPEEVCTKTSKKCIGWEDINFQTKVITVSGATSKIRRLRTLNELPDNLWAFLALTAPGQRHGPVCDISYSTLRRIRRKVLGKAPQDIFRHCFASYGYHYLAPHLVIEILGHVRQFKTFEKYYKGQADQKSAKEYFSIFPNVS